MTIQNISLGTAPNDKTGDNLRVAGGKINANFAEVNSRLDGHDAQFLTLPNLQTASMLSVVHDAGATTYNYSSLTEPADGATLYVDFAETNIGAVTLARNGGNARSLRNSDGSVLGEGQITPNRLYLVKRVGTIFEIVNYNHTQWVFSRANYVGVSATIDGRATRTGSVLTRIGGFSVGDLFVQVSDGAGGLTIALRAYGAGTAGRATGEVWFPSNVDVDGSLNVDGSAVVDGALSVGGAVTVSGTLTVTGGITGLPYYSPANPPPSTEQQIELLEELGGIAVYEALATARGLTSLGPFQYTPSDDGRALRLNVNGGLADFGDMLEERSVLVNVISAGTLTLYTGVPTVNWTDRTSPTVRVSKGRYRVHRGLGEEWEIEAINGKTITDADLGTYPLPAYNRRIPIIGYSNGIRTMKNIAGWRDQFVAWGENPSVLNLVSGKGASSFLKGGESDYPNNHWYNWENDTFGPNWTSHFLPELARYPSSPAMEFCIIHIGYADMSLFSAAMNSMSVAMTEAQMVAYWIAALEKMKGASGLNLPSLKFVICPMAHRGPGPWDPRFYYAMRRVHLEVCAQRPDLAIRGPDSFDLRYIWRDYHPTFRSQAIFSGRWARWTETAAGRKSEFLGPKALPPVAVNSTTTRVTIDIGGQSFRFPGYNDDLNNAPLPVGFRLVPPGTTFIDASPISISKVRWFASGGNWVIEMTHADQGGTPRLCWPYGEMYEVGQDPSLCLRAYAGEPLMTFHPSV